MVYTGVFPKDTVNSKKLIYKVACRELSEETGLQIGKILSSQPLVQEYSYSRNDISYNKKVFYCIALVKGKVSLQKGEVLQGQWVSFQKAISLFSFEGNKKIAYEVANFLKITL